MVIYHKGLLIKVSWLIAIPTLYLKGSGGNSCSKKASLINWTPLLCNFYPFLIDNQTIDNFTSPDQARSLEISSDKCYNQIAGKFCHSKGYQKVGRKFTVNIGKRKYIHNQSLIQCIVKMNTENKIAWLLYFLCANGNEKAQHFVKIVQQICYVTLNYALLQEIATHFPIAIWGGVSPYCTVFLRNNIFFQPCMF